MSDLQKTLEVKFPKLFTGPFRYLSGPVTGLLRWIFREQDINDFLKEHQDARGMEFIDRVLEHFNVGYAVASNQRENIPDGGRVVIIANHPLGALDALALIRLVGEVRADVKVVGSDLLLGIEPLRDLLLPIDNLSHHPSKDSIRAIQEALEREHAVILFPSGEVSRMRPLGVRDIKWQRGFLKFATKASAPIVPVFINARNSPLFYAVSTLYRRLAALLLVREMNTQRGKTIRIKVGERIPIHHIATPGLSPRAQLSLVKRHLYRMGLKNKNLIRTERAIAHPEPRQPLMRELTAAEHLGDTPDGKKIYLFDHQTDSPVMREIGRLREVTFRRVGEGTGKRRDLDDYDRHYRHIVLWDETELEIVGAYRIAECRPVIDRHGFDALYTHTLFRYAQAFNPYLNQAIEVGRSFVQPRYWGSRALDYLWQGIGAYLESRPDMRYLYGPVSISDTFPKGAKDLMVYFYTRFFVTEEPLAEPRLPYRITPTEQAALEQRFQDDDINVNIRALKGLMSNYGVNVPTLYKQYVELCEPQGVRFLAFNVDPDFANCVDGLIMLDMDRMKDKKMARYLPSRYAARHVPEP